MKKDFDDKKVLKHGIIGAVVVCIVIVLSFFCAYSNFNEEEAEETIGTTYDYSDGWAIADTEEDDVTEIELPYTGSSSQDISAITLTNSLKAEYAGLSLSLETENCAIRVFVDGKPVYESGFDSNKGNRWQLDDNDKNEEQQIDSGNNDASGEENNTDNGEKTEEQQPPGDNGNIGETGELPNANSGEVTETNTNETSESGEKSDTEGMDDIEEESMMDEEVADSISSGNYMIDLGNTVQDGSIIRVRLVKVDNAKPIKVVSASIGQRDAAIISVVRGSLLPLGSVVILIMCAAILATIDLIRMLSHNRVRGLVRLSVLALDVVLLCLDESGLTRLFFSNDYFFSVLNGICFLLMPLLILWFLYRGFMHYYPKLLTLLGVVSVSYAVVALLLEITQKYYLVDMWMYTIILLVIILVAAILMLLDWHKREESEYHVVWMDIVGYSCLLVYAVLYSFGIFLGREYSWMGNIRILLVTVAFIFFVAQHVHIFFVLFQEEALETARTLEKQVKEVESKNLQLSVAREEAEEARLEAIAANEAKSTFLANMSHEIRTPINAVLGMDEMIMRETKEREIKGYAMDIYTSGQTLLSLINDILDFSKIESGKLQIVPVDYDISSLIHDLYNMTTARAKSKDLVFTVEAAEDIPSRYYGDDVRIRQILTNILTNAIKYTPEGQVWFRVSGHREGDDEILHFEIEDTGIGIKEEDMPKLFGEYERIEESRNRNIEGTGLGMSITLRLLSLMDSQLDVKSEYGKGSVFSFDLRQKIMDETLLGDFTERIKAQADNYTYAESFIAPEARILVTDDNSMNRKVFISLLKATQIMIDEAAGGQEAIDLVKANHYDIIFMDHMMPEMDGVEAMHKIRELPESPCKDTPIYVLTANAVTGARESYLAEGFDGFLSKPIVSDKLEDAIRNNLPEELIVPVEGEPKDMGQSDGSDLSIEELPMIDGLDWYYAAMHLPIREVLEESVREFVTLIPTQAKKLATAYSKLPDEEAYEAYRIQVHGMKSSASTIGIVPLAGMARVLEASAAEHDEDAIRRMHDIFMREWYAFEDKLEGVFGIGEDDEADKPMADMTNVMAMINEILDAMEEFDVDTADSLAMELEQYSYDKEVKATIKEIRAAVTDLDEDLVRDLKARLEN